MSKYSSNYTEKIIKLYELLWEDFHKISFEQFKEYKFNAHQVMALRQLHNTPFITILLSIVKLREALFKSFIPCVNGNKSATFCNACGITSYGSVAPEKISIGKYKILATTLAILVFLATPPTINPILNIEIITRM